MPEMCDEQQYREAEVAAAGMLSRRPLSAAMLEKKLLDKEFAPEAVDYAVERMRLLRAIDDEAYAETIIRSYRNKGYGALRIRQELYQRGVPKEIAAELLKQMEPNWDKMHALLEKSCAVISRIEKNAKRRWRHCSAADFLFLKSKSLWRIIALH